MTDSTTVHIGENSPEHVAHKLMHEIAGVEGKTIQVNGSADREWILDTYMECLIAVRGSR